MSRSPTVTATIATEIDASSSSAAELVNASRRVLIVARRCRWLTSPMTSTWRRARPYATRVGRPRMTSRKCPDRDERASHRRSVSAPVARPMSAAKYGSSGSVSATMSALTQSTHSSAPTASTGTTTPATSAGRKRAAYGSTDAAPWAASVTARSGSGRCSADAVSQRARSRSRSVAVTSTPTQAATRSDTQARTARSDEQAGEPRGRSAQRRPLHDRDHEGGDREGQGDRRDALEHADDRQDGDRPASGRCRPEQSRVERRHFTATARGMCWVPMRLRNVQ